MGEMDNKQQLQRLGIYCRVSSKKQMDNTSLNNQKVKGIEYCERNNYDYEVFSDIVSGRVINRDDLNKLFQKIYDKELDGIILYEYDRLQRDNKELLIEFEKLIEDTNCVLIVDNKVRDIIGNLSDRMEYEYKNTMSTIERMRLKKRVGEGIERQMERGNTLFGRVKFGFKNEGKKSSLHTIIDEDESPIVEEIFRVFNLKSVNKFIDCLLLVNKKFNKNYQITFIYNCLKYEGYSGVVYQKWGKKEYKITLPPIISKELFNKTKMKIQSIQSRRKGRDKEEHLLKGLIHCKGCDDKMYNYGTTNHKTKQSWYRCKWKQRPQYERNRLLWENGKKCKDYKGNYINRWFMEIVVWDSLFKVLSESEVIKQKYEKLFNTSNKLKDSNKHSKSYYEGLVEKTNEKKFKLYNDLLEKKIKKGDYDLYNKLYDEDIVKYDNRITELDVKMKTFKTENKVDFDVVTEMMKTDLDIKHKTESIKDKRRIIDKYINKIYLKRVDNDNYLLNFDLKIETNNNKVQFKNTYIKNRILWH